MYFLNLYKEMTVALKQCETVNAENAELNAKINSDIEKMDQTLSQYS